MIPDRIDEELLALLAANARRPIADLARSLRISRATVQNRISRLVDRGVVRRFTVDFGPVETTLFLEALVLVRLVAKESSHAIDAIKRLDAITTIYTISGHFDLAADVRVRSTGELDDALLAIRRVPDVVETQCSIRMTRRK